ncbi:hypothetical protein CALVIDRAFT_328051 [Calocera viscosa TUFC12733]|uniref:Uncharacterized protein n=1 Tax=Calocera viscosa (strain TUFC12733) TaxID=1330018 RepID=A0A167QWS1_CALVF|nr:hypothetical protein CALVIDRAFT_328051 [Calocera viscosa TUFC12733]
MTCSPHLASIAQQHTGPTPSLEPFLAPTVPAILAMVRVPPPACSARSLATFPFPAPASTSRPTSGWMCLHQALTRLCISRPIGSVNSPAGEIFDTKTRRVWLLPPGTAEAVWHSLSGYLVQLLSCDFRHTSDSDVLCRV